MSENETRNHSFVAKILIVAEKSHGIFFADRFSSVAKTPKRAISGGYSGDLWESLEGTLTNGDSPAHIVIQEPDAMTQSR